MYVEAVVGGGAGPIESHSRLVIVSERQKERADDLAVSGQSRSQSSCDLHPVLRLCSPDQRASRA